MRRARSARGELGWVEWIRQRSGAEGSGGALRLGIGDDCAILQPAAGDELLVTTDFCLEGRHFRRDWHPPKSAGHRTLARGLSDLAAMGARPMAAFLSLALPPPGALPGVPEAEQTLWTERFLEGLLALARRFGVPLAGGDTSAAPDAHILADIVLLGSAPAGTALRRSGARPGDVLYVTGVLGGAAAELQTLQAAPTSGQAAQMQAASGHPQLFPEPRLPVGEALRSSGWTTACMDLSDGLSTDLAHLCAASGVSARVEAERLPASPWLGGMAAEERLALMLHGGEDYELLFTAAPQAGVPPELAGVPLTCIGSILPTVEPGGPTVWLRKAGREEPLAPGGWEHLRG